MKCSNGKHLFSRNVNSEHLFSLTFSPLVPFPKHFVEDVFRSTNRPKWCTVHILLHLVSPPPPAPPHTHTQPSIVLDALVMLDQPYHVDGGSGLHVLTVRFYFIG